RNVPLHGVSTHQGRVTGPELLRYYQPRTRAHDSGVVDLDPETVVLHVLGPILAAAAGRALPDFDQRGLLARSGSCPTRQSDGHHANKQSATDWIEVLRSSYRSNALHQSAPFSFGEGVRHPALCLTRRAFGWARREGMRV